MSLIGIFFRIKVEENQNCYIDFYVSLLKFLILKNVFVFNRHFIYTYFKCPADVDLEDD